MSVDAAACAHDVVVYGLCAHCGAEVSVEATSHSLIVGAHKSIVLSLAEFGQQTRRNSQRLVSEKKLLLVLDLDHTLIHTTDEPNAARIAADTAFPLYSFKLATPTTIPHNTAATAMNTVSLRPHCVEFISALSSRYDIYVYTHGVRAYADAVVALIDPAHKHIKRRVVTRTEATTMHKTLRAMYPCDDGLVAIVDDRIDVWGDAAANVLRAYEYYFFHGREVYNREAPMNGNKTQHKAEQQQTTSPALIRAHQLDAAVADNVLLSLRAALVAIHSLFFSADLPLPLPIPIPPALAIQTVIDRVKQSVLSGCHVVFSSVISRTQRRSEHELYRTAAAFGARVYDDITDETTHVIGVVNNTDKMKAARALTERKIHCVHLAWLITSVTHYARADETLFDIALVAQRTIVDDKERTRVDPALIQHAPHVATAEEIVERTQNFLQANPLGATADTLFDKEGTPSTAVTPGQTHRIKRKKKTLTQATDGAQHVTANTAPALMIGADEVAAATIQRPLSFDSRMSASSSDDGQTSKRAKSVSDSGGDDVLSDQQLEHELWIELDKN